jgi:conjugative relaxase-like TrwC/TraI family protein
VAGFALTFSPPKTVSVLWALGDEAVSGAVLGAHEAAVGAAMAFLEDHAAFTWRGRGGLLQVDTEGLLAAAFVHRTSRAADPQLHTHLLLANKVRTQDGRWLSLDARELFAHQKAAGMLYKAALRSELTGRCGVSWSVVDDNGVAEIEGVPDGLCAAWSARRQAVKAAGDELVAKREAELARSLTSSERATCFQLAAYRTRAPKVDAETPTATLKARWHEEAVAFGHDPARWLPGVLGHERPVTAMPPVDQLVTCQPHGTRSPPLLPVAWDHPRCQLWDHPEHPPMPAEQTLGWASEADAEEARWHSGRSRWCRFERRSDAGCAGRASAQSPGGSGSTARRRGATSLRRSSSALIARVVRHSSATS